ncbi:MAG TPA: protein kinase [Bryobacteraceae bacterium]
MPLSPGDRLDRYEILRAIGEGGMGEVYRAHDPRAKRDVAIKLSKEQFSERFDREARAIAALNHPNICHLYDVGPNYLVMEYVEGESPQGPMPLAEALAIARQIAAGLEAAHEKGIVHRDLKPANIRVTPDGTVKVLDFGLAKTAPAAAASAVSADSPTFTLTATHAGIVLGTAPYMAPEQARGKPVDKRADIWAFGVVLYELVTGQRLFRGEDVAEVLAGVINAEPKLDGAPPEVLPLLRACLEKDPKRRLRDIGDAWRLLEPGAKIDAPVKGSAGWMGWAAAAVVAAAAGIALWAPWRAATLPTAVLSYFLPLAPKTAYIHNGGLTVSPDGRRLAFAAVEANGVPRLWIQPLDSAADAQPLPATEGPLGISSWSRDSRWVFSALNGKLVKVNIAGGAPVFLCDLNGVIPVGGSENAAGRILLGSGTGPILEVPAAGGTPKAVTSLDSSREETAHNQPIFMDDGRHFLYFRRSNSPEKSGVYIGDADSPPERQDARQLIVTRLAGRYLHARGSHPAYVLFLRDGNLFAQAFDDKAFQLKGEPVRIADRVGSFLDGGHFSVSDNGLLIYRGASIPSNQLTWLDRQGRRTETIGPPSTVEGSPMISPAGTHVVFSRLVGQNVFDLWRVDVERKSETRLAGHPISSDAPVWSWEGNEIVYTADLGNHFALYRKPANATREETLLLDAPARLAATNWSRDGRFLLYTAADPNTGPDVWALRMDGSKKKARLLGSPAAEAYAVFSPNMRWMAYSSTEAGGVKQVLVRELLPVEGDDLFHLGPAQVVSRNGGTMPVWRDDGKELFFQTDDLALMAAPMGGGDRATGSLDPGEPARLFQEASILPFLRNWSVNRKGDRFLIATLAPEEVQIPFTVMVNWEERLGK